MLAFILALVGACGSSGEPGAGGDTEEGQTSAGETGEYPLTIADSVGREVEIGEEPQRIASMAPSITEALFEVGAGDRVVGVTSADDYPPQVEEIEEVGSFGGPSVEAVVAQEVDLLMLSFDSTTAEEADTLEEQTGASVVVVNPTTVDEAIDTVGTVGQITGNAEEAEGIEEDLRAELEEISAAVEGREAPSVFYEVFDEPLQTAGGGSFIGDAITLAGGENIAAEAGEDYPQYSVEQLLNQDPEYYLLGGSTGVTPEDVEARENFGSLAAVEEGNVVVIDDELVSRPGPRIVEGIREMAEVLHPEAF